MVFMAFYISTLYILCLSDIENIYQCLTVIIMECNKEFPVIVNLKWNMGIYLDQVWHNFKNMDV